MFINQINSLLNAGKKKNNDIPAKVRGKMKLKDQPKKSKDFFKKIYA
jgi:hypothetical protein